MSGLTARETMWAAIRAFTSELDDYPGWQEWRREKLSYVLAGDLRNIIHPKEEILEEFRFSAEIERQHNVIMLYLQLHSALISLQDVEYYFRRYPFHGLPVSHDAHVTYICEMYFSRFYEFRERLKKYLNAINEIISGRSIDIGKLLKHFDREFRQELVARNSIHHHEAFDDVDINYVRLAGILPEEKGWGREQKSAYRRVTREWVGRVRQRSARLEEYLEAVAHASVNNCEFLASLVKAKSCE